VPDAPPRLLGRYKTPRFRLGDVVRCARRGEVRITGVSDAPTPWPVGQTLPNGRARSLVLYGGLAEAVKRESAEAVMYFWGVKHATVWAWRKALGVGQYTEGTRKRKSEAFAPHAARVNESSRPTWSSQERRAKISAAKKGKPRPPHVVEAMRRGRTGKPHDEETRQKMSKSHRERGTLVPGTKTWTAQEDELVRTLRPKEAAQRTGRTLVAVWARRRELKLPDGRKGR
jgi:hypothetical protein